MAEASTAQLKNAIVTTAGFITGGETDTKAYFVTPQAPDGTGTFVLATTVPADGAELISAKFTVTSGGSVTTSGTNAWSVSDGTNVLFTLPATSVTQSAGAILSMTTTTATNGKAIATTAGARLILTNTEAGTVGDGMHGFFTFVWGL